MQQIDALSRIYDNFENLIDGFLDFPETDEALRNLQEYITAEYFDKNSQKAHRQWLDFEDYVMTLSAMNERQGFIYGFQYAVSLMAGGVCNAK